MRSTNDFLAFLGVYRASQEVPGIRAEEAVAMVRQAASTFLGLSQDATYATIVKSILKRTEEEHDNRAKGRRKGS